MLASYADYVWPTHHQTQKQLTNPLDLPYQARLSSCEVA
jgi:hypothetical protein